MNYINPNLIILLVRLTSDEELARKFSNCKTLDQFYDFCNKIVTGYTKKELHELLMKLSSLIFREKSDKIILNNDLEKVVGGMGTMSGSSKKYLSGILAALSMASAVSLTDFNAKAEESTDFVTISETSEKESVWAKLTQGIGLGVAAGTVVGTAVCYAFNLLGNSEGLGLPNLGVSCYMNAMIQQLYSIRAFHDAVMADRSNDPKTVALQRIFTLIDRGQVIRRSDIEQSIRALGYSGKQEDTNEFLIDGLDRLLRRYRLEYMFTYPLVIAPADVLSLEQFLRDDDVMGRIAVHQGQFGVVINRTLGTRDMENSRVTKRVAVPQRIDIGGREYSPTGVVVHMGYSMDSGHYYSYKRNVRGPWLCYDDSDISDATDARVNDDMENNGVFIVYTAVPEAR